MFFLSFSFIRYLIYFPSFLFFPFLLLSFFMLDNRRLSRFNCRRQPPGCRREARRMLRSSQQGCRLFYLIIDRLPISKLRDGLFCLSYRWLTVASSLAPTLVTLCVIESLPSNETIKNLLSWYDRPKWDWDDWPSDDDVFTSSLVRHPTAIHQNIYQTWSIEFCSQVSCPIDKSLHWSMMSSWQP